jgi:hypothetical protein
MVGAMRLYGIQTSELRSVEMTILIPYSNETGARVVRAFIDVRTIRAGAL